MTDGERGTIAEILEALESCTETLARSRCCVGFDGFVDNLYRVVKQRESADRYECYATIGEFGKRISDSAGRSSDTEIVRLETRAGGNAPNLSLSLASLGFPTDCVGLLGEPEIHPCFQELERIAECVSIGNPAVTQAFEFNDGKLMFGCMNEACRLGWGGIQSRAGHRRMEQALRESRLIGVVNWSCFYSIGNIVREIVDDLRATLPEASIKEKMLFFDLADVSARSRDDILEMADAMRYAAGSVRTALGLNENEARTLGSALGIPAGESLPALAKALAAVTGAQPLAVHTNRGSIGVVAGEVAEAPGFHVDAPVISTGGGDNFNGGFCAGLLLDLPMAHCLVLGNAAASLFVSRGRSCTIPELLDFLAAARQA